MAKRFPIILMLFGAICIGLPVYVTVLTHRVTNLGITALWGSLFVISGAVMCIRDYYERRIKFRRSNNLCVGCGYDLRGHDPYGYRCPECGKVRW